MYEVRLDEAKLRKFDPLNDAKARDIYERYVPAAERKGDMVPYPEMGELVPAAVAEGYNHFRVFEPSVQGHSVAVTDPDVIEIVQRRRVGESEEIARIRAKAGEEEVSEVAGEVSEVDDWMERAGAGAPVGVPEGRRVAEPRSVDEAAEMFFNE